MNIGENIKNAVHVLYKTYENVNKLMEQCKSIAEESGYLLKSDKFLRWKSDGNPDGWLLNSFIMIFQRQADSLCVSGNDWRDGAVYALEICLGVKSEPERFPELLISKFEYEDISEWPEGVSPADHWGFYQPVHEEKAACMIREKRGPEDAQRLEQLNSTYRDVDNMASYKSFNRKNRPLGRFQAVEKAYC